MDTLWHIFIVVVMAMLFVNLSCMLRLAVMFRLPSPTVSKECREACTPDKCACWDKEQKRRRADLDRQALGGEDVRDV
jgi:hypothetical protein